MKFSIFGLDTFTLTFKIQSLIFFWGIKFKEKRNCPLENRWINLFVTIPTRKKPAILPRSWIVFKILSKSNCASQCCSAESPLHCPFFSSACSPPDSAEMGKFRRNNSRLEDSSVIEGAAFALRKMKGKPHVALADGREVSSGASSTQGLSEGSDRESPQTSSFSLDSYQLEVIHQGLTHPCEQVFPTLCSERFAFGFHSFLNLVWNFPVASFF